MVLLLLCRRCAGMRSEEPAKFFPGRALIEYLGWFVWNWLHERRAWGVSLVGKGPGVLCGSGTDRICDWRRIGPELRRRANERLIMAAEKQESACMYGRRVLVTHFENIQKKPETPRRGLEELILIKCKRCKSPAALHVKEGQAKQAQAVQTNRLKHF